ncbi:MAG: hypothetical protein KDJ36_03595 [Hyphomicrobiaceae bacterium]|nr:hypothetical protein [Hyphomicrobiaceae bacterium]
MTRIRYRATAAALLSGAAVFAIIHLAGPQASRAAPPSKTQQKSAPETPNQAKASAVSIVVGRDLRALPAPVREMREAILAAAQSGDLKELLIPIQWNELPPDFGPGQGRDPRAHFRKISVDGEGREILAILRRILSAPYAVVREGRDIENNKIYVWPYLARMPLTKLSPQQDVDLLALVDRDRYGAMRKAGRYSSWFVMIGADGTWHTFRRQEK